MLYGAMNTANVFSKLLIASFILACTASANWMYLGITGVPPPLQQQQPEPGTELENMDSSQANAICGAISGLTMEQMKVCLKHPGMMYPLAKGAKRSIQECQYQFRHERWNCTTSVDTDNVFGYVLESGSKEAAFIHAVTSAGVAFAITQGCSLGDLPDCSCDTANHGLDTPEGWKWGGCSDNVAYGIDFTRKFVDASEPETNYLKYEKSNGHSHMNLHNNEVGRQVVSSLMKIQCRCHGVSGSCELKTCWKMMTTFNEVGDILKSKYNQAILLRDFKNPTKTKTKRHKGKIKTVVKKADLIHIHRSPNYCKQNAKKGILGTKGRLCNASSVGRDSCSVLCCGRGYNTLVLRKSEKCRCKFVWCCYMTCETCEMEQHNFYCK